MSFTIILAGALLAALAVAIVTDLRARIIPNALNAGIALAAPLWWWANGWTLWPEGAIQLAVALFALALFLGAFALGAMGGGDVKLIAALGLWLKPLAFLEMLVWMSLIGGVLTVVTLVVHKLRKAEGRPEIPYGVAIALATAAILTERYIYHFSR